MILTSHETENVNRPHAIVSKSDIEEAAGRLDSSLNKRNIEKSVHIMANN